MRIAGVTVFALLSAALSACSLLFPSFGPYETPQQRLLVGDDRYIHMMCMGEGSPTVILSAGGGGWSVAWRQVQPKLAAATKVCAWDRAGHGFSSGSPDPQDLAHTVDDLERALDAAGIDGPVIMVGHSLGSFESLLFADRHPNRVAAMVLVDPSTPDQEEVLARAAPALMAWSAEQDEASLNKIRSCISAKNSTGENSPPECSSLIPRYPERLRTNLAAASNEPMYWEARLSLQVERARSAQLVINEERNFGAMPLIVLSAGVHSYPSAPAEAQRETGALENVLISAHEALARLSSRGAVITVPDSSHGIPAQKPQAVIEAIERVVDAARDNLRSTS